jgi:hypothetical protein
MLQIGFLVSLETKLSRRRRRRGETIGLVSWRFGLMVEKLLNIGNFSSLKMK